MTREQFLSRLRAGLSGLPASAQADIMADYEAHFTEAAAKGRSEAEVAEKLGDPSRLAREIRAEAGLKRWEEEHSAGAALGAVVAVLGLATIDIFVLLPILLAVGTALLAAIVVGGILALAGAGCLVLAVFNVLPGFSGSWLQGIFLALGIASGGTSVVAFCILFLIGAVNALVRYARLHIRAASPMVSSFNANREFAL